MLCERINYGLSSCLNTFGAGLALKERQESPGYP